MKLVVRLGMPAAPAAATAALALAVAVAATVVPTVAAAQQWQPNDNLFNPSGIPSLTFSQPRLADLDDDHDLDLILGSVSGAPLHYRNVGTPASPAFAPGDDIFAAVTDLDAEMAVAVDLDADGDLDLVTGGYTGLHHFRNDGTPAAPHFVRDDAVFAALAIAPLPVPALADLDADGDLDLLIGLSEDGGLKFYPNGGTPQAASFSEASSQLWFDVGLYAYPWFGDLDGDLDIDLVVGRDGHGLRYYRNVGTPAAWQWEQDDAVFAGIATATYWNSPCLTDLTGDGKLDLVYGTDAGPLQYYVNTGTLQAPVWTANTTLFGGVLDVGAASSPVFIDMDDDGDLDLASGSQLGDLKYYENTGTAQAPAWRANHAIFAAIDHSIYAAVALGDIDDDGLVDAVVGDLSGNLFLHRNTGTTFVLDSAHFAGVDVGAWSVPRLVDLDRDGDLDLAVGNEAGTLAYFRNQGTPTVPSWVAAAGFFGALDVGSNCVPTFGDVDGDGDLDLVAGNISHEVRCYLHQGLDWIRDDAFVAGLTAGQNAAPALADLDGDGDLDLTIGNYAGTFNYYENVSPPTAAPDAPRAELRLAAAPNPFNPATTIRFTVPADGVVSLAVFDVAGRQVRTLVGERLAAGEHAITWNGADDAGRRAGSGVYLCRLVAGRENRTIRLVMVK